MIWVGLAVIILTFFFQKYNVFAEELLFQDQCIIMLFECAQFRLKILSEMGSDALSFILYGYAGVSFDHENSLSTKETAPILLTFCETGTE